MQFFMVDDVRGPAEITELLHTLLPLSGLSASEPGYRCPFFPVPLTLQTLFVLLSGMILKRYAVIPVSLYVVLGALGLPVFHCGSCRYWHPARPYRRLPVRIYRCRRSLSGLRMNTRPVLSGSPGFLQGLLSSMPVASHG